MRSFMSRFSAAVIHASGYKKKVGDPVRREKYIEKLGVKNAKKYRPPISLYRCLIQTQEIDGTDIYYFNDGKDKKIIYLHGGAFCEQPLIFHWRFCDKIAFKTDSTLIFPIYKKSPEFTYKPTFELLEKCYRSLLETTDSENIFIMGDSSGGGLALSFCEYLNEISLPQPKRMILISPWLDVSMEEEFPEEFEKTDPSLQREFLRRAGKSWAGDTDVHSYLVSPIYGSLENLAAMTVYSGTHEAFIIYARRFKEKCESLGIELDYHEYEGMNHCFPIYPIPEAKKAQKEIIELINS